MVVLVGFAVLFDRITRQGLEIRALRGLLPVCCFCKKIRKDDQTWERIEVYIAERSEARFTHTFCPECAREHYPAFFRQSKRGELDAVDVPLSLHKSPAARQTGHARDEEKLLESGPDG